MLPRVPAACLLLLGVAANLGCATVFSSGTAEIVLQSHPGMAVFVDGAYQGQEPVVVKLDNHQTHVIAVGELSRPSASCTLVPGIGVGWIVLDIFFAIWPIVIDALTGDWTSIDVGPCAL